MRLELNIRNTENIEDLSQSDKMQMEMIVEALVSTGALSGVKGGKAIIHFDHNGVFQKIQLDYFPFVRRKSWHDSRKLVII